MVEVCLIETVSTNTHIAAMCRFAELPAPPTEGLSIRYRGQISTILEVTYDEEFGIYRCDCGHADALDDDLLDVLGEEFIGWTIVDISPYDDFEDFEFDGC